MKRALVLVTVLAVSTPAPGVGPVKAVAPVPEAPAATVASVPEVVDDPCLPGDPSCATVADVAPAAVPVASVVEPPARAPQRPHGGAATEAPPPVAAPPTRAPDWDPQGGRMCSNPVDCPAAPAPTHAPDWDPQGGRMCGVDCSPAAPSSGVHCPAHPQMSDDPAYASCPVLPG